MSRITLISFIFLASGAALAQSGFRCALDDCSLPVGLHQLDGQHDEDTAYAWLQHDLAAARASLRSRDHSRAGQTAAATHAALSAQAEHIAEARGRDYVLDLHEALSEVMREAGRRAPEAPRLDSGALASR